MTKTAARLSRCPIHGSNRAPNADCSLCCESRKRRNRLLRAAVALAALGLVWFAAIARDDKAPLDNTAAGAPESPAVSVAEEAQPKARVHAAAPPHVAASTGQPAVAAQAVQPERSDQQGEEQLDELGFPAVPQERLRAARARRLRERLDELKQLKQREPPNY